MPSELWKYPLWVSLGTFKNSQKARTSDTQRFCGAVTVTLQGKFRSSDAWWWATILDIISWLWSTRPLKNRTQRTLFSLSILALWWPSAPGIAAMWAWLHGTISVCSATWHWEAGIRWLHYCKWPAPVTHTNTRTHVCALANTQIQAHTCCIWNPETKNGRLATFICNWETIVVSILSLSPKNHIFPKHQLFMS